MTVEAVAIAFSGVVLIWLVRVTVENREQFQMIRQVLLGVPGESSPTGLVHRVETLAETLDAHFTDERVFWSEVKDQRREIRDEVVDAATAVVGTAQLELAEQIDKLRKEVKTLADRRFNPRPTSESG